MIYIALIVTIPFLIFIIMIYRGHKVFRMREAILKKIENEGNEILGQPEYVSYHGGYPDIPKPQKLSIAMSNEYLFFITNRGEIGRSIIKRWHKIETFSTSGKCICNQRSSFLSYPSNIISSGRIRNFIDIHYTDSNDNDNHILIEPNNSNQLKFILNTLNKKVSN